MKAKIPHIARILLGLVFFGAGLAGLLTEPPPLETLPEPVRAFNVGLMATGYFMKLLKVTEVVCGLLLLSGYFVPLALVVLAPIALNIFLVHAFMMPEGLPVAIGVGLLMVYLAFFSAPYSSQIKQLFRPKP